MSKPTRASADGRAYLDLQNLARRQRRSTQELLVLYVLERFLARLAVSAHRDRFVLKGGLLLAALNARRPTVDAGLHDLDVSELRAALENTAIHRKITLRPLSAAVGDLAAVRARTYETYRRRLGQDAAGLPEKFLTLVDDVTAFADPLLVNESGYQRWQAPTRTWIN